MTLKLNKQEQPMPPKPEPPIVQFRFLVCMVTVFALCVLGLIYKTVDDKYALEMLKIQTAAAPATVPADSARAAPPGGVAAQAENVNTAQLVMVVESYVLAQNAARAQERKSLLSGAEIAAFINGLVDTKALTKEAAGAAKELSRDVLKAGLEVTVDTIKKITSKLLGSDDKPEAKDGSKASAMLGGVNINVACAAPPAARTTVSASASASAKASASASASASAPASHCPAA
jgi:hypothetical protein